MGEPGTDEKGEAEPFCILRDGGLKREKKLKKKVRGWRSLS